MLSESASQLLHVAAWILAAGSGLTVVGSALVPLIQAARRSLVASAAWAARRTGMAGRWHRRMAGLVVTAAASALLWVALLYSTSPSVVSLAAR